MSSVPNGVNEPFHASDRPADGAGPSATAPDDPVAALVSSIAGIDDTVGLPPAAPPPSPQPVSHPCSFTGVASDYFRIWIVNLLLTLITLGLWSPWAKVRKRRYFYGHTWVADANFEYHGNPVAILRGRLLAAAAFGIYWIVDHLRPGAGPWLLFVLIAGAPWIIARSLTFNAVNSSHRGIRFGFAGRARAVAAAIWPIVFWPLALVLVTRDPVSMIDNSVFYGLAVLGVYMVLLGVYPYAIARVRRLTVEHASWGQCHFESTLRTRKVYVVYGIALLLGLLIVIVLGASGAGLVLLVDKVLGAEQPGTSVIFIAAWTALGYVLAAVIVMGYTRSRITNLVFNTARLGDEARFASTLSARKLARLYFGNLILILITCGLMIPWAVMRVARYRVESLAVIVDGSVDDVAATVFSAAGAAGEELGEMFGFDLAL
jgi:uncharacterized membrane protein YjgN (DUF898 family)